MEPVPTRRRRWWLAAVVAAGVAGAAVVVGITMATDGSNAPPPGSCAAVASRHNGVTGPVDAPPAGHGLQVVDKGFTQLSGTTDTVSLGAVVQNRSTLVAYRTRVTIRVFDRQHHSAVPTDSGELLDQEIPVILPGQRIGVGAWTYLRETRSSRSVTVAGFDIDLGATQWWPADNDVHTFRSITTHHLGTERSTGEQISGTVRYSVDSAFCDALTPRGTATVFRDSSGTIVGGTLGLDKSKDMCVPGKYTESTDAFRSLPPDIDDSRTKTYPYCDPAPVPNDPLRTDAPIN